MKRIGVTVFTMAFVFMVSATLGQDPSKFEPPGGTKMPHGHETPDIPLVEPPLSIGEPPSWETEVEYLPPPDYHCGLFANYSQRICYSTSSVDYECFMDDLSEIFDRYGEEFEGQESPYPCNFEYYQFCFELEDFDVECSNIEEGYQQETLCIFVWLTYGDDTTICSEILQDVLSYPCSDLE